MIVISGIFSLALWFYVLSSEKITIEKVIQIEYLLPENYSHKETPIKSIKAELYGPRFLMRKYLTKEVQLLLDIDAVYKKKKTSYSFNMKSLLMNLPFGLRVNSIEPENIEVQLANKISKKVEVQPFVNCANYVDIGSLNIKVQPREVVLYGPKEQIDKIDYLYTEPINCKLLNSSFSQKKISVFLDDERLQVKPNLVDLSYLDNKDKDIMTLKLPIHFVGDAMIKKVSDSLATVRVKLKNNEHKITKWEEHIWVSTHIKNSIKSDKIPVDVKVSEELELIEVIPSFINVETR
jgi:YbbR domain-containing protein